MTRPNLFIIGAAKAGTSSLHAYLAQHPQIFMSPVKEPHFFSYPELLEYSSGPRDRSRLKDAVRSPQEYSALFQGSDAFEVRGEASVTYLDSVAAPGLIRGHAPDAKIVVVLRNPVERAYASYLHLRRDGVEWHGDFVDALQAEEERIGRKWGLLWHYTRRQFTFEKLARYFGRFERCHIRVWLYDDWNRDNRAVLREMFEFLEVDSTFSPDISTRRNVGGTPRIEVLHRLVSTNSRLRRFVKPLVGRGMRQRIRRLVEAANRRINLERPALSPEVGEKLTALYREDILRLQDLIGRDLSGWLNPRPSKPGIPSTRVTNSGPG